MVIIFPIEWDPYQTIEVLEQLQIALVGPELGHIVFDAGTMDCIKDPTALCKAVRP